MRSRAFTLIELVLVMLIISLVIGVAAPSLSTFMAGRKLSNAANQLVALAHHGRAQTISEGRSFRLNVDTNSLTYWLEAQNGAEFKALGTENGQHYALPEGTKASWTGLNDPASPAGTAATVNTGALGITTGAAGAAKAPPPQYVQFYPDGRCDSGTLVLQDNTGRHIELGAPSPSEMWRVIKDEKQ